LLRRAKPIEAELHHLLNHDASVVDVIRALGVPYDVHTHDFAWFCPRIALVGRGDRYCGEPTPDVCEACVAEMGSYLHEDIRVVTLLDRSRGILSGARRIIAPSEDAANRMARHFPDLSRTVIPHEDDAAVVEPPPITPVSGTVRVCVAGAIGLHKGFHVLLACARDARERALELSFIVAGTTIDDQLLIDTGRAFVTGPYEPDEAVALIRAQNATLAFLPSIWPETWCLGLTELWRAGLRVAAFDMGAPAKRIARTGRGFLMPLGLSPAAINDALMNAAKGRSFLPIQGA
jgi:glycosyltransferase involved in cell wall biosynthesis